MLNLLDAMKKDATGPELLVMIRNTKMKLSSSVARNLVAKLRQLKLKDFPREDPRPMIE
jgi:hypothetical protein